nr:hypothetical protein CFP56_21568 [Quercus suber]
MSQSQHHSDIISLCGPRCAFRQCRFHQMVQVSLQPSSLASDRILNFRSEKIVAIPVVGDRCALLFGCALCMEQIMIIPAVV